MIRFILLEDHPTEKEWTMGARGEAGMPIRMWLSRTEVMARTVAVETRSVELRL